MYGQAEANTNQATVLSLVNEALALIDVMSSKESIVTTAFTDVAATLSNYNNATLSNAPASIISGYDTVFTQPLFAFPCGCEQLNAMPVDPFPSVFPYRSS